MHGLRSHLLTHLCWDWLSALSPQLCVFNSAAHSPGGSRGRTRPPSKEKRRQLWASSSFFPNPSPPSPAALGVDSIIPILLSEKQSCQEVRQQRLQTLWAHPVSRPYSALTPAPGLDLGLPWPVSRWPLRRAKDTQCVSPTPISPGPRDLAAGLRQGGEGV